MKEINYNEKEHKVLPEGFEGIIPDMSNAVYHSQACVSNSGLKESANGGEYYKYYQANGLKETKAKDMGSLFHDTNLMDDDFVKRNYMVHPKYTGVGSRDKNKKFDEEAKKLDILVATQEMLDSAKAMRESIMQNKFARMLVENSLHERSHFYNKIVTDVHNHADDSYQDVSLPVRFRPDIEMPEQGILADLKKVGQISKFELQKSINDYGYYYQDAFYCDGYSHTVREPEKFYFVFVLDVAPYTCIVRALNPETRELGQAKYNKMIHDFAEMTLNDSWYSATEELGIPDWVLNKNG